MNPLEKLTRRESEVVALLAQGKQNKEIALILTIAEHTVERHLTRVYRKLEVNNRVEATTLFWQMYMDPKNNGNPS